MWEKIFQNILFQNIQGNSTARLAIEVLSEVKLLVPGSCFVSASPTVLNLTLEGSLSVGPQETAFEAFARKERMREDIFLIRPLNIARTRCLSHLQRRSSLEVVT